MTDVAAAECAIRQLHARYVDAVWRKDIEAFVDCFAEDGEWKIAGLHMRGRDEIGRGFEGFLAGSEKILMLVGAPVIEVGDDGTAIARTPISEIIKRKDGEAIRTIGLYYERFVEQGGRWRFRSRHWNLYYYGPPDFSASFHHPPEYGPPPAMPAPDEPTLARK
jgi:uncharacterized protein (TIGR02246 family)